MRPLRAASLVVAFVAATGLVLGTFGFSAMSADRGIDVGVADDERAYLGYNTLTDTVHSEDPTPVVEYHNRFDGDIGEFRVNVSLDDPDGMEADIVAVDTPDTIDGNAAEPVSIELACSVEQEVDLLFETQGSGAGVSVSLDRTHTVTCVPTEPLVTGVTFADAANAQFEFEPAGGHETVDAVVWQKPTPPKEASDAGDLVAKETEIGPADPNLRNALADRMTDENGSEPGENWKLVAIEFPNQHVAIFHPGWDAGAFDTVHTGEGVAVELDEPLTAQAVVEMSTGEEESEGDSDG